MKATLNEKIALLPMDPGCYLMKDKNGEIIYVGKAKHLKNRVSSYFTGAHDYKTTKMVAMVDDFDTIITLTEKESLILEINLIKTHRPRFNILFMDDKSYPYLKLNREGNPLVQVSRDRKQNPKFYYFGPYPNATAARVMTQLLNETLPTKDGFLPNKQAFYTALNKTETKMNDEEVDVWRQGLLKVLNGHDREFRDALEKKMTDASLSMNFEVAQLYKEKLEALDYISDRQQVQFKQNERFDMFNYAFYQGYLAIVGLFVRAGRLLEKTMTVEATMEEPEDAFISFIVQFYHNQPKPRSVYIPLSISTDIVEELLDVEVVHAIRGKKKTLMDIGYRNAELQLQDQFQVLWNRQRNIDESLHQLQTILGMSSPIHRIELFDNSHISGSFAVSACVVFVDGVPDKNQYRRYRLSTGADDLASMKEVVYRRYFRLLKEGRSFPDLVVIDGGFNQLKAAKEVLNDLEIEIRICSLVKDEHHRTRAIMLEDGTEVKIDVTGSLYSLTAQMQEEVHRYVITYHRLLRKKAMTRSILDEIEGLGEVSKKKLYRRFKSLKGIRSASLEELSEIIPTKVAQQVLELLRIDWNEVNEKN